MKLLETDLPDVHALKLKVLKDGRGLFVKTLQAATFSSLGLRSDFLESYFSVSCGGTVRGMHFQVPPADHAKLVSVISGRVLDVVLCLQTEGGHYGRWISRELSLQAEAQAMYIPSGYAHGFLALSEGATLQYMTTSIYDPKYDAGIRWDSFGFDWPVDVPTLSDRDLALPGLQEFDSPF